ncbi:extracellular ribonuclease LE-like [Malania oleifera]|uniref:extracellular ribonuclease LE-like n=1 Tax=Malania oleifera TaxID=397392 RepID=UPI0025AEAA36|nr:extracellular ribonuclease LE-like [Malania oleifera]
MNLIINHSIFLKLFIIIQCLSLPLLCPAQHFDFFYFVQQWPGSYCDTNHGCCYPETGKPEANFSIHGLWPNFNNGSYPQNCNRNSPFTPSTLTDLTTRMQKSWPTLACPRSNGTKFWTHEWTKHGTCSESVLDQYSYFKAALDLKHKIDLLRILLKAGIRPNGRFYRLRRIIEAIKRATGYASAIECNVDRSRNNQLFQIYLCVDTSGSNIIECPVLPKRKCPSKIEFPSF